MLSDLLIGLWKAVPTTVLVKSSVSFLHVLWYGKDSKPGNIQDLCMMSTFIQMYSPVCVII